VTTLLARLRDTPHPTQALALLNAPLAAHLGLPPVTSALMRVTGNAASVETQLTHVGAAHLPAGDSGLWQALGEPEGEPAAVLRLSVRPSELAALWHAIDGVPGVWLHACVRRGIVRCLATDHAALDEVLRRAPEHAARVGERLSLAQWDATPPNAMQHRLARGIRSAFDPKRILNPGILGDTP